MWDAWERREKCTRFWWEIPNETDDSEDQSIDARIGSEWMTGRLAAGCDLIRLAQDRDRWRAVMNVIMNLRVLKPRVRYNQ
jgi:hypothetical protein